MTSGVSSVIVWTIMLLGSGIFPLQMVEVVYGTFCATEVKKFLIFLFVTRPLVFEDFEDIKGFKKFSFINLAMITVSFFPARLLKNFQP